jgi:fumarate hydratase class I
MAGPCGYLCRNWQRGAVALPSRRTQRGFAALAAPFRYDKLFDYEANPVDTKFRKLTSDGVSSTTTANGQKLLEVDGIVLEELSRQAIVDIQHLFRPAHLNQLRKILLDPEASSNDRFVALELLKNACVSAGKVMPSCQDTGTATVLASRGGHVLTDGCDEEHISKGIYRAYTEGYLRYSQVAPQTMFREANTKNNLPAQIDLLTKAGDKYDFLYVAKGGGSANKTQLLQKTKSVLNEKAFTEFVKEQITGLGTAACPPYHLALCVGGLSAEQNLKTVKLASCKYLDGLPTTGSKTGRAFRDVQWEEKILNIAHELGIGAQYGGKYFVHDVRVIRLPRHGASCPIGIGVSCSADRQAKAKITEDGVFLEELETEPAKYLPDVKETSLEGGGDIVKIDLNNPMEENLKILDKYPVSTRLSLTGTIIVARDIAHAQMQTMLDEGQELPEYIRKYPVYYAGPAKTPAGMPSGSFGPTTAGRMDTYVESFQSHRGSMIMIGKGNRSSDVTKACKKHGGFYLGSIGGVAATLSQKSIKKVEVLDMEELGMEAVWKIEVEEFPAFVVVDNKGNDFFKRWSKDEAEAEHDSFFDESKDFFYGLDQDSDGTLSLEEIARGLMISPDQAKSLLERYDVDGDGVIDIMEFELMILKNADMRSSLLAGMHEHHS